MSAIHPDAEKFLNERTRFGVVTMRLVEFVPERGSMMLGDDRVLDLFKA